MRMKLTIKDYSQLLRERGIGRGHPVQVFIASEAIRLMWKYTPKKSKVMAGSAKVASGGTEIHQYTPYAQIQYKNTHFRHRGIETHHWFEAMKRNGGTKKILRAACKKAGAR